MPPAMQHERPRRVGVRLDVLVGVEIKVEVLDLVPAIGQKHRSDRRGSIARLTPPSPALATVQHEVARSRKVVASAWPRYVCNAATGLV